MRVLALYNFKGGVGKTAAVVNLAYLAAREGSSTLIWDLDPQAATTYYFRVAPRVKGGSRKLFQGRSGLGDLIKGTDFENLDLLPADFSYRHTDLVLGQAKKSTKQLKRLLRPLAQEFDWLFLDCPPSLSLLSENVFRVADALLIPTVPDILAFRAYQQLRSFLAQEGLERVNLMPFLSQVDESRGSHREALERQSRDYPELLPASVPYASEVEQMGVYREPVPAFAPSSEASIAYQLLWREIKQRVV